MNVTILLCCSLLLLSCSTTAVLPPNDPPKPASSRLLPDGHTITPAGKTLPTGPLPTGIAVSPDGRNAVVVNSGFGDHTLTVLNIPAQSVVQTLLIRKSWLGAAWGPYGDYFFVTGGNDNKVYRYGFAKDSAWFLSSILLGKPAPEEEVSPAGLDIDSEGRTIFTVSKMSNTLFKLNAFDNTIEHSRTLDGPLYTCLLDESRKLVFVSLWSKGAVSVHHAENLSPVIEIPTGKEPTALLHDTLQHRLFVANAGENTVSVINLNTMTIAETIDVALVPNSLPGSVPSALALAGDSILVVALSGNNALAMVDIRHPGRSSVIGFIPTGWYPTAVAVADSVIIVANGKGNQSYPNPDNRSAAELISGSVSIISLPSASQLAEYTRQVKENNPFTRTVTIADWTEGNPIPRTSAVRSPITHVFYIFKEMRSYDQIFGDMAGGDGDTSLAVYKAAVTPNHHALAKEFVLLDNFHANGTVPGEGLQYAVSGHANAYVKRTWPTLYGRKGGEYDLEREGMTTSSGGYLWDNAMRNGLRVRNYGLFVDETASGRGEIIPMASGLASITSPIYRGWDLYYYDTLRAEMWIKDFDKHLLGDSVPRLSLIRLPNDNTAGESQRHRSRRSYLADNDRALGKIVERISNSPVWPTSVIFVLETSAFGGADHVDAHRTVGLVIGPHVRRGFVDHTHYTTTSVVGTIERILGLPFMTQHDAGAMPMYRLFRTEPDLKPFQSLPISNSISQ